jgi:hypothetical protein
MANHFSPAVIPAGRAILARVAGVLPHESELAAAVAELYARFESYPLRSDTDPCAHCHSPEEERVLHSRSLRMLSARDLAAYAADAMLTWGGAEDLKHFLPRIFEIVATEDFGWPDLEVVFSKLRHAGWSEWPPGEIAAVERYLRAKWRAALVVFPPRPQRHDADSTLCAIAQAVDPLEPFLRAWLDTPGEAPARHLASYLWDSASGLTTGSGFGSAFWSDRRAQQDELRRWLCTRAVLERLNRAFFSASSEEAEGAISRAISIAEVLVPGR